MYLFCPIYKWRISPIQVPDLTEAHTLRLFLNEQYIFMRGWPDVLAHSYLQTSTLKGKIDRAPLPTMDTSITSRGVIGAFCYVIPRYVEYPELLMQFYQQFYTPDAIVEFAIKGWICPPFKSVYENPDVLRFRPYYRGLSELLNTGRSRNDILYYHKVTGLIRREVNLTLRRLKSGEDALNKIADELHKHIYRQVHERRLHNVIEHIKNNLREECTREQMARKCHLSPSYFSSLFKQVTGVNFAEYVNQNRVEKAKTLVETSELNIAEIAQQVGFSDQSYFCQVFRKFTHMTPTQYRLNAQSSLSHH
jgi:AraC-like DNA-binding protein